MMLNTALTRLAQAPAASASTASRSVASARTGSPAQASGDVRAIKADSRWRTHIVTAPFYGVADRRDLAALAIADWVLTACAAGSWPRRSPASDCREISRKDG
jgi:hypothetical protein